MDRIVKMTKITYKEFKDIIESFVSENFTADMCKECHELGHDIVPMDYKGSYDKALKKLFEVMR